MEAVFTLERATNTLFDAGGRRFAAAERRWLPGSRRKAPAGKVDMFDAIGAVGWLQRESGSPLREPIGVIGPRDGSPAQLSAALEIGEMLGECRLAVLCGGRQGVMQAVCEGAARVGGVAIGLLPESDASQANPFVNVAIATGIGEARNALIARASFCLIAVGNSLGTLSEVALGLHFGKRVIGLEQAADLAGVRHVGSAREAVAKVAETILALD